MSGLFKFSAIMTGVFAFALAPMIAMFGVRDGWDCFKKAFWS